MTVLDLDAVHKAYPGGVQALRGASRCATGGWWRTHELEAMATESTAT
jgi:hypothetical protein